MPRDLYDFLGVPRSADGEDIRKAYLIRTRVVHPDRFNRARQPAEWLQANDMLRELNEAYEVLSDPVKRSRYDASTGQAGSEHRQRSHAADARTQAGYSESAPWEGPPSPSRGAVEGFLDLCQCIRATCWQQIQTGPGDRATRLSALMAAHGDYNRRASPWLSIIIENHPGNTPVITQARNAAAKCLSSLAGGFIGVDYLESARILALEALPLIFDDDKLEAEVKGQLDYITVESQKSAPPEPGGEDRQPVGAGRSSVSIDPKVTLPPAGVDASHLFRYSSGLVAGIAVFVALMFFTKSNVPQPSALQASSEESRARTAPQPDDFKRLTLDGQLKVLMRANPQEKQLLTPIFNERFNRDIDKVPEDERELFFRNLAAAGLPDTSGVAPSLGQRTQGPSVAASRQIDSGPIALDSTPIDPCLASSTAQKQRRPINGYESDYDHTAEGHGKLTVVNGNSQDAAVMLSSPAVATPDRLFYVRAGMEATITGIEPGRYRIEFQIGKGWDSEGEIFQCVSATAIFDKEEVFEEQKTETDLEVGVQYSHVQLTLHKVVGGNARTSPLNPSAFRRRRKTR